ncbi:MAG TPA: hypothetical protein VFE50_19670 [Cyclobacteriaceae bacterium]|nr:hypothetical protein [Cyclobacteriaceae bacterium]
MKLSFLSVFALSICNCFAQSDEEGFTVVKSEPPFEVHERWIEYPGKTPAVTTRELKSEFTVRAKLHEIVRFIKDESQITSWQSHVSMYKIYHKNDTSYWEEYSRHDVPWPVSDQDSFLEYRVTEINENVLLIAFKSRVDDRVAPVYKDVNRVELNGSWKLERLSNDVVKVTYRIQSAPVTNLPRIIVDPFIRNNLLASMRSMSELVEK